MSIPEPQPILSFPTEAAIFLVLVVLPGSEAEIAGLLADVSEIKRSVGFRVPEAELSCGVGIGAGLWDRLTASAPPAGAASAHRVDLCLALAQRLTERLDGRAEVVDEVRRLSLLRRTRSARVRRRNREHRGRRRRRSRADRRGGSRVRVGGSYAIVQKYHRDLRAVER